MNTKHIPILALACGALFAAVGCRPKANDAAGGVVTVRSSSGGRDLHVVAVGGAWVSQAENQFIVKVTGHEIVMDRERVLVDQKEGAKVPAGATKFDVDFTGGTLRVKADDAEILHSKFPQ